MPHLRSGRAAAVFRWAVFEMAKVAQQALDAAGVTADDLDVLHPAPGQHADHRLDGPDARSCRHRVTSPGHRDPGNTSAASIPLAMERLLERRARPRAATPRCSSASARVSSTPARSLRSPESAPVAPATGRTTQHHQHRRRRRHGQPPEEIVAGLAEIVNEIAGIPADDVQLDKSFTDDLDVDSLSMVEVVVAAEEKFDVKIPDDEVKNLKTVGDAVAYIERPERLSRCTCQMTRARHTRRSAAERPPYTSADRVTPCSPTRSHRSSSPGSARPPLGGDVASTWDALLAGRPASVALTEEWAAQLPVRIAAQLAVEPDRGARPGQGRAGWTAPTQFALIAAARGVGRRRPGPAPASTPSGSASSSAPASAACRPCSTRTTSWRRRARAGSPRTPCRC